MAGESPKQTESIGRQRSAEIRRDFENELRLACLGWKALVIWKCQTKDAVALREVVTYLLNGPPVAHRPSLRI